MRQLHANIHVELPLRQGIEIVGEALPVPGQTLDHHRVGNILDSLHQVNQPVSVLGLAGGEAHAAISHHDRGHPVPGGGLHPVVPCRLTVIMGMNVDEAGRHDQAAGVDPLPGLAGYLSDLHDLAVSDANVGHETIRAGAIHDRSATDDQIK